MKYSIIKTFAIFILIIMPITASAFPIELPGDGDPGNEPASINGSLWLLIALAVVMSFMVFRKKQKAV